MLDPHYPRPTQTRTRSTMGRLTTHVLDTAHGRPAAGMAVELRRCDGDARTVLVQTHTNTDGRCDTPLLEGTQMQVGYYELVFDVQAYFRSAGVTLPEPAFLHTVVVPFGISDGAAHYHVPLLVSPWSYSTYRGS